MGCFNYYLPVNLLVGKGMLQKVGMETKKYGKKVLIVTGKYSTKKTGVLDRVMSYLKEAEVEYVLFDQVEQNPTIATVTKGAKLFKEYECDSVIGLGGGSAMDCAKGIAFICKQDGNMDEYIFGKEDNGKAAPVILITTTAGTGSEGDSIAVLTNELNNDKKALKRPSIYPKVSIIDSSLMTTLPPHIIAATGFDALSHCIEAYTAKMSTPFTEALALMAIEKLSQNLLKVYEDPSNEEAWEEVAVANTTGGMVIDMSGISLPHALEHPVSGLLDVVHGKGLAALFIAYMEVSYKANPIKFYKIAKAMGADVTGCSIEEGAKQSIDCVKELLCKLELDITLTELGVKPEMIEWLSDNALKVSAAGISNSGLDLNKEGIKEIYCMSL